MPISSERSGNTNIFDIPRLKYFANLSFLCKWERRYNLVDGTIPFQRLDQFSKSTRLSLSFIHNTAHYIIQHITCWGHCQLFHFLSLFFGGGLWYNITLCINRTKFPKALWLDCLWLGALIILSILPPWLKWTSFDLWLIWSLMIPWSVRADSVLEVDGDPLINNSRCPLWLLPSSLLLFWDILNIIPKKSCSFHVTTLVS